MKNGIARQFSALARNSFSVLIGDPLFLIIHVFLLGSVLAVASLPGFTLGGQLRLVRDQIAALSFVCGCFLATVGTARIVGDDLRKGMMPTIMSRPVAHWVVVSGKWLGLAMALLVIFSTSCFGGLWASRLIFYQQHLESLGVMVYLGVLTLPMLCMAAFHYFKGGNYFWQTNLALALLFPCVFLLLNMWGWEGGKQPSYGALVHWNSAVMFIYIYLAVMVFSSIVFLLAVLADSSMLMALAVIVFFSGLFSDYLLGLVVTSSWLRALLAIVIPDWQMFWIVEKIGDAGLLGGFLSTHLLHAFLQSAFFILLASVVFERKEVSGTL